MTDVGCNVSSCTYWGKGDSCTASRIEVQSNFRGSAYMEAGTLGGANQAKTSSETACKTFKLKS
ncbi:MAG: DUF1540 domain-containing protein [Firmicutes bacterium]|nr:DUF1540 domain-containing protein [Bacillota bacterium]MCL5039198.1 DUF1540 domain-containing protein [Bacillota bacterium]